jgi:hypothetical protein
VCRGVNGTKRKTPPAKVFEGGVAFWGASWLKDMHLHQGDLAKRGKTAWLRWGRTAQHAKNLSGSSSSDELLLSLILPAGSSRQRRSHVPIQRKDPATLGGGEGRRRRNINSAAHRHKQEPPPSLSPSSSLSPFLQNQGGGDENVSNEARSR